MSDLYGLAFQKVLYPTWESGFRRRPTLSYLRQLERTERCSLDELQAIQATELRRLVDHAYKHSPYYHRAFAARGVVPTDIRTIDDLGKLPLLSRKQASDSLEDRSSSAAPLPRIRKMTSGTTGSPLAFAYDVDSEYWRQATKLRGYGWAGYRPGDRSLHFWGSMAAVHGSSLTKRAKVALDHRMRRERFVDCSSHSNEALSKVVRHLRSFRPQVIVCYAQAGAALARHIVDSGSRSWKNITVISAAERLFPRDRDAMKEAFGPNVFDTYGSREVMLIAGECEAHEGLHVSMENLAVEIIVREGSSERPALPGELGEVVVTDLHNYGAPFIRYVNGDLAVAASPQRCPCGRGLTRIQGIEGRQTETLRDGQGRPVGGMFFIVIFAGLADKVRRFQVVQRKDRSIDLKLVPAPLFDDSVVSLVRRNCERVIPGIDLRTHVVPDIPVGPGGKSRVVVVEN